MTSSFHICENCNGSCERVAREALVARGLGESDERLAPPRHTPWGAPDHVEDVKPGIVAYATPSHGGWWVTPALRAKIPACMQIATCGQQGVSGWFEQDCDVCWVVACFPDLFGSQKATAACGVMSATFDCLRKGMDASRERNWIMALRCAYAKNGLAYGWQTVEA